MTRLVFIIFSLVLGTCFATTCEKGADGSCAATKSSSEVTVLLQGNMKIDEQLALESSQEVKMKVADDSCQWANDGACDENQGCSMGTDCSDCKNCGGSSTGANGDSGISASDWDLLGGGSVKYSDIQQGALGDCYFLASLSAIAYTHPELIKSMFTKGSLLQGPHPVYTTKWVLNGKPTTLAVNNMMPANPHNGLPYFVQEKGGNYWPLVLEKTWAKLFGGYKPIESGLQAEVFKAMTQAPVETYVHNKITLEGKNEFWNKLVGGTSKKFPMGATTPSTPPGDIGVIGGHAYALLGAFSYTSPDGTYFPKVVQLFNPHHKDHYKGVLPNVKKSDGSFFLTLDEFLNSYDYSFIANVVSGAKLSHKVIKKDTTMALEFTMTGDDPFAVQLEWASKRLLKGCGWMNPKFMMLVAKEGDLTSAIQAVKPLYHTNARADMAGGNGKYYVFVRGTFPTVNVLQELVVNVYGTEASTIDESSQYPNPNHLFLAMKGLCKTMSVPGTGLYNGGAAHYTLDESTLVNMVPTWKPTSDVQHISGYEVVFWRKKKLVMGPSAAEARTGVYYPSVAVDQATCASLIQENELTESKMPVVELHPLALMTEKMEDMDEDTSFDELSGSSASAYSAEGCRSAVARLQTLDKGDEIADGGIDYVFPESMSSIAADGVNCGDTAIGQSESCEKYNHWMSITQMKTLVTAFKSDLEGGCVQKAIFNEKCMIDTTLCQTPMKVMCSGWGYTFQVGGRFPDLGTSMCGTCQTTSAA